MFMANILGKENNYLLLMTVLIIIGCVLSYLIIGVLLTIFFIPNEEIIDSALFVIILWLPFILLFLAVYIAETLHITHKVLGIIKSHR